MTSISDLKAQFENPPGWTRPGTGLRGVGSTRPLGSEMEIEGYGARVVTIGLQS